jgi:tetratricopeptide (TPR) repeat protein
MTEQGLRLYKDGKVVEAAQAWLKVLEKNPTHREARLWLAQAGRRLNALPAAPPLERPTKAPPSPAERSTSAAQDFYKQGLIAYAQDHVTGAIELWERALEKDPSLSQAQEALRQARAEISYEKSR